MNIFFNGGRYQASRPDYSAQLFKTVLSNGKLYLGALVADIGAGTEILTKGVMLHGYNVIAIEPNSSMRIAADHALAQFSGYRSVGGSAESMPIDDSSIDLITAAQSFHWFEINSAKAECLRVLRPNGYVALIWNERVQTDTFQIALNEVFDKFGGVN